MRRLNVIGPAVIRLRSERGWTQEVLAARLQCSGADITRDMLANIETGRTQITDDHITAFQKVFQVEVIKLFPKAVQELDERFAARDRQHPIKRRPQRRRS